jgi:hypothetical protein
MTVPTLSMVTRITDAALFLKVVAVSWQFQHYWPLQSTCAYQLIFCSTLNKMASCGRLMSLLYFGLLGISSPNGLGTNVLHCKASEC